MGAARFAPGTPRSLLSSATRFDRATRAPRLTFVNRGSQVNTDRHDDGCRNGECDDRSVRTPRCSTRYRRMRFVPTAHCADRWGRCRQREKSSSWRSRTKKNHHSENITSERPRAGLAPHTDARRQILAGCEHPRGSDSVTEKVQTMCRMLDTSHAQRGAMLEGLRHAQC